MPTRVEFDIFAETPAWIGSSKLSEYRTALITAAVTGKIDVRGFKP